MTAWHTCWGWWFFSTPSCVNSFCSDIFSNRFVLIYGHFHPHFLALSSDIVFFLFSSEEGSNRKASTSRLSFWSSQVQKSIAFYCFCLKFFLFICELKVQVVHTLNPLFWLCTKLLYTVVLPLLTTFFLSLTESLITSCLFNGVAIAFGLPDCQGDHLWPYKVALSHWIIHCPWIALTEYCFFRMIYSELSYWLFSVNSRPRESWVSFRGNHSTTLFISKSVGNLMSWFIHFPFSCC